MSEDTLYKRLSDELKPYYEDSDCCTYIVELRKYKREAIKEIKQLKEQLQQKENIIKEVREYIKDKWEMELKDSMEDFLDHDELIDRKRLLHILEILDKVD